MRAESTGEDKSEGKPDTSDAAGAPHCQTLFVKGHRRRICRPFVAEHEGAQASGRDCLFDQWIAAFRAKAMAHGITEETYARVMSAV